MFLEKYISRKQVAERYPISVRKLVELHKDSTLAGVTINGKIYYLVEEVDAYFLQLAEVSRLPGTELSSKKRGRPTKLQAVRARQNTLKSVNGSGRFR